MVSDRDIAAKIREAAPGGTLADVKAAWAVVRGRLNSRDDSETAAAFDEVLGRAELRPEPTAGDVMTAHKLTLEIFQMPPPDLVVFSEYDLTIIEGKIADALAAARGGATKRGDGWLEVAEQYRVELVEEQARVKALEKAVEKIWGMARTLAATSNMTGRYAQSRAIEIHDALAALVNPPKAEEVEK